MNIYKNKKIYPNEDTPLKEHYSDYTDVFIGLIPFFKTSNQKSKSKSSKEILTLEEAREKDDLFKKINAINGEIYSTSEDYPEEKEIFETGRPITWSHIIANTSIQDYKELNKALMTSIGAYHTKLRREDKLKALNDFTERNNIWHPTEGSFGVFVKQSIFKVLTDKKISSINVQDEYYEKLRKMDIATINWSDFVEQIDFKDYYIYSKDESILFSIGWDYFFFFVAIDNKIIDRELIEANFEGFWASDMDTHLWTWEEGEIDQLMNRTEKRKSWWKRIIK